MKKSFADYVAEAEVTVTKKAVSKTQQKSIDKPVATEKHAHVKESVMNDHTGSTFEHICNTFKRDVANFKDTGELSDHLYDALYDYYFDDMPYGTKKARDGDPYEWIGDRFYQDLGIDESAFPSTTTTLPFGTKPRPENIPAVMRKAAGKDFPLTTAQVGDTSNNLSDLTTLRKMAGLPPRPQGSM